jgi:aryl-alcohol dehydrogenase-like predicted oxidoreductase
MTQYQKTLSTFLEAISRVLTQECSIRNHRLKAFCFEAAPELQAHYLDRDPTLTEFALRFALETPGIHVVLVGMRKPEYVQEAFEIHSKLIDPKITQKTFSKELIHAIFKGVSRLKETLV